MQTLTAHAKGTATNPKGDIVPLWTHSHDKDGKSHYTFNDNADELLKDIGLMVRRYLPLDPRGSAKE